MILKFSPTLLCFPFQFGLAVSIAIEIYHILTRHDINDELTSKHAEKLQKVKVDALVSSIFCQISSIVLLFPLRLYS